MQFIIDSFDFLINTIKSVFGFFTSFIRGFLVFFEWIGFALDMVADTVLGLPDWLQTFALVTITLSVIYLILGRNSGG